MYTLITVLLFITCILLILIVLVQNSKGGGLASNFQASNQIMGVRKTTDFLEKATWGENKVGGQSVIKDQIENAVDPNQLPSFPAPAPITAPAPVATDSTK